MSEAAEPARLDRALLALSLALYAVMAVRLRFVCDDAYISFRYARNLAEGLGLVYNPGERVEGYSNFLWVLAAAGLKACGLNVLLLMPILGALCGALLIWRVHRAAGSTWAPGPVRRGWRRCRWRCIRRSPPGPPGGWRRCRSRCSCSWPSRGWSGGARAGRRGWRSWGWR